jgi:hypothetical protein
MVNSNSFQLNKILSHQKVDFTRLTKSIHSIATFRSKNTPEQSIIPQISHSTSIQKLTNVSGDQKEKLLFKRGLKIRNSSFFDRTKQSCKLYLRQGHILAN